MKTLTEALYEASELLRSLSHSNPDLEARILLCHLLEKPQSYIYAWPEKTLAEQQSEDYQALIERRLAGEPIAHITRHREFWSLSLKISSATLIPRPETELVVERALEYLIDTPRAQIADLGTGSGAIALAIASERPDCRLFATDQSNAALDIARQNAENLQLENIMFYPGNWFEALPHGVQFELILSNPPYIPEQDKHLTQGDLLHEPDSALISGADGLDAIRLICNLAGNHLKSGGLLLLEHGFDQAKAVRRLLAQAGFTFILTTQDLAGHDRITEGRLP